MYIRVLLFYSVSDITRDLRAGHEDRQRERRGGGRSSTAWHAPYSFTLLFRSSVALPIAIARCLISTLLCVYFSR
jgi:hypothetical protein